jgi:hypothetical protein
MGDSELSLTVEEGSICVAAADADGVVKFPSVSALVAWLTANKPAAFSAPKQRVMDKIRGGTLFKWS